MIFDGCMFFDSGLVEVEILVDIRLGVFGVEKVKSGVTTQHAVELVQKKNIPTILFFFHFFFFFSIFFFMKQWIEQWKAKKRPILKFSGVLMQFGLLSASKKQKIITQHRKAQENNNQTRPKTRDMRHNKTRDKLIKRLDVILAKTSLTSVKNNR